MEVGNVSLGHISQTCPLTYGLCIRRHDEVVNFLYLHLCQRNIRCIKEPWITTDTRLQKPDLLVLGNNITLIIDVQIRADSGLEDLDMLHNVKCAKYVNPALLYSLIDKYNNINIKTLSVTYSWRGAMSLKSFRTLKPD